MRTSIYRIVAGLIVSGGLALATITPAAAENEAQGQWLKDWESTISKDYLDTHGHKWVSEAFPTNQGKVQGYNMARGVFSCTGGGRMNLVVWNLVTQQQEGKTHDCNGDRHHTPVVAFRKGESVKLVLESSGFITNEAHTTKVEGWFGR
jgi:hypothetical protein